jgi:hypothetical protein
MTFQRNIKAIQPGNYIQINVLKAHNCCIKNEHTVIKI